MAKYKRILLKLSGEALMGNKGYGIDPVAVNAFASEIKIIIDSGIQVGVVIGGGNIFRGLSASEQGMERVSADHMGMLATVINSLAMQDALEKMDIVTRVLTAIKMDSVAENFVRRRAIRHLEKNRVVIMAAGTGNPYFTTDTAAVLRAVEIQADAVFKATKVDGVYDKDPVKFDDAVKYNTISYDEVLAKHLKVMDATAIALCADNNLPLVVFNIKKSGNLVDLINGKNIGTTVNSGE